VIDLNTGSDLILFDSLDRISEKNAIPLVRNHKDTHPRNGAPLVMVKNFNRARFGPSPNGSAIWADHPVSGILRLADGKLHCVLCLRVWSRDEVTNEVLATPLSGTWVKEVHGLNDGPERPVWDF